MLGLANGRPLTTLISLLALSLAEGKEEAPEYLRDIVLRGVVGAEVSNISNQKYSRSFRWLPIAKHLWDPT